jgi:hypothetical protein
VGILKISKSLQNGNTEIIFIGPLNGFQLEFLRKLRKLKKRMI